MDKLLETTCSESLSSMDMREGIEGCINVRAASQNCGVALSEQQNRVISTMQVVDNSTKDSEEVSCNKESRQADTKSSGKFCHTIPPVRPANAPMVCMNCWPPSLLGDLTTSAASALINV